MVARLLTCCKDDIRLTIEARKPVLKPLRHSDECIYFFFPNLLMIVIYCSTILK
jgi:hypothetical protein